MKTLKPRSRFRLLYWFPVVLAVVSGYILDRRATALRVSSADERFEQLSKRLDTIQASMQKRSAVSASSADSNATEIPLRPSGGIETRFVCRPRVLGSGRSGDWMYTDVRHVDGQVLRYYLRRDASPLQVKAFVHQLAEDSRDRMYSSSFTVE